MRKNEYDERANVVVEIDAEGHRTEYERDARDRLLRTRFPDGAEERRAYDERGRLSAIKDARGGVTRFAYDSFGRLVSVADPLGGVTRYAYEAGAGGLATPTSLTRPDGVVVRRAFDAEGALAEVVDGEGRHWAYRYGAFDVLQEIVDPKGGSLRLAYDSEGRLTEVVNAVGGRYRLERDVAGRVAREVDFDGRATRYRRDKVGRVVETVKPNGAKLVYAYDKSGLVTGIETFGPDGAEEDVVSFRYDRRGLLIEAKNSAARVEFTRDRNGRVVEEDTNGRRVKSRYDSCGRRVERRVFTGLDRPEATRLGEHIARYAYDPLGAVAEIVVGDHAPLSFARDALGRETRRQSRAGFALTQDYDPVGQLREQAYGARGTSPHRRRFSFDRAGSPLGIEDTIFGASAYSQDANGQTVQAAHGATRGVDASEDRWFHDVGAAQEVERFAYDGARNLFSSGGGEAWLTSVGGVVAAARGPNGERIALTHDACGRVVERRIERSGFRPQHWSYGWDAFDRLVWCETPDGERWSYAYDPFGRREEKRRKLSRPGEPLRVAGSAFTWDGDVPVEEIPLKENGTLDYEARTDWHFLPGSFTPLAKSVGGRLSYVVSDHLGTPRELLSEMGELEWAASYRVWGSVRVVRAKRRANGGDDAEICPLRFPGQWSDAETGLYYNRHRHYDPLVGQYASPDPIGLEGGDRPQGYVATPGCWCDPLGLVANAAKPIPAGQSFKDFLQNVTNRAEAKGIRDGWVQMGTGLRQGTLKHSYADRLVVRDQRMTGEQSAIRTEVTQRNGMPAPRNSLGSSRADAFSDPALGSTGEVGDYKVTPSGISPGQMSNYNQNFPGSPILTIRPQ